MSWKVLQGDVREKLQEIPSESVQTCITSPPYFGLRDYGNPGQIGLEPTPEEYVANMVEVFRGVWKALRDDGTVWLNLGDSFSTGGVISNFANCFNRVMEGGPVIVGHTATIGITAEGINVSLEDKRFPYGELFSLFGIERVIVKQRDNDFCQILYTFADPCYCWVGVPALSVSRNMADLEIVFDSGYDISIIITEHNPDGEPKLRIPVVGGAGAGINSNRAFAIKEPCKPITETIRDGETIGDAISFNATLISLPNIYFVDKTVSLGDGLSLCAGDVGNFSITKATLEQFNFLVPDSGFNVAVHGVSHFYASNVYGSFIHYNQLYHKAEQLSNEMQAKQELGVPEMVKRALMRDGWICRSTIIWHKPNPMPESVTDRPTKSHEYIFLLTKSQKYFYDAEAVKEESVAPGSVHVGKKGQKMDVMDGIVPKNNIVSGATRNRRSVWTISTKPYKEAHFAVFPEKLIEPCILAGTSPQACEVCGSPWERVVETTREKISNSPRYSGCKIGDGSPRNSDMPRTQAEVKTTGWQPTCTCPNEGKGKSVVLDPFAGSGTTLWVAEQHGRDSIGIELSGDYCKLIRKRMDNMQQNIFGLGVE